MPRSYQISAFLLILGLFIFVHSCRTPAVIATLTIQQADEYNNQMRYREAISGYQKYIQLARGLGVYRNLQMEGAVYRKLAHASSALSLYDSALFYLRKAVDIDSVGEPNTLNLIEDYRMMGLTYGYKGDYLTSIKFLERSLGLNTGMEKDLKDTKRNSAGDTHLSIARVNYVIGNYREAELEALKAFSIFRKIENEFRGLMESYLLLGKIKIDQENISDGMKLIENSLRIAETNMLNTSGHYQALGSACLLESKYEEALKYRLKSLEQAERSDIVSQISWMNVKVGEVYSRIGDDKKALGYYEKALSLNPGSGEMGLSDVASLTTKTGDLLQAGEIYAKTGSMTGAAMAGLRLGEMYEKDNKPELAELYFNRADSIFTKMGSSAGQANARLGLCRLLINRGAYGKASDLIGQIPGSGKNPELGWQIHFEKGRICERQKDLISAFREYSSSIEIIEKIRSSLGSEEFRSSYMTDKMHVYERLIMLLMENRGDMIFENNGYPPVETAFYYSERARSRSFLDLLGNKKISSISTSDTMLMAKEYSLRQQIGKLSREIGMGQLNEPDQKGLENYLESLTMEYNKTLDLIRLNNKDYNSLVSVEPSELTDIQNLLAGRQAVVDYWIGMDRSVIWVISGNRITARMIDAGSEDIERMISGLRSHLKTGASDFLAGLFKILISPVSKEIKDYTSIYVIPHRSLHFLPFQALIDTTGKYLIENFNISYAPSASVLKQCSIKPVETGYDFMGIALGNITVDNFSPLPGTRAEIRQIVQLYPQATVKYENETSETYFREESDKHTIIHLATHGHLDSRRPMNSFLLLHPDEKNDGRLTVDEIFDLNLKSKLVVLSACETGLGMLSTGDEMIGLSRAFIYAGTPAIIVSLWPVEDASTALLMTRLHQYYSAGYGIQEALAFAQRDLINNNFTPTVERGTNAVVWENALKYEIESGNKSKSGNPFYWAPFILIGYGG